MTALTKVEPMNPVDLLTDIDNVQQLSKKLMQSKHYQKMGEEGIFAICMTAKSIGMPQLDALNGELYYVQGKVGMAYEAMNKYIRLAGHSVSIKHLDDKSCTLVGKRKDSGDIAEITYTTEDAKKAGKTYDKHPKTMLFARCLSMLKRFLFPDVCTKVYVKEELDDFETINVQPVQPLQIEKVDPITTEQTIELQHLLNGCDPDVQKNALKFIFDKFKIEILDNLPSTEFERYKSLFTMRKAEYQKKLAEAEMEIKPDAEVQNAS